MSKLKMTAAAVLALGFCLGARADDGCTACGEKKAKCRECDKCVVSGTAKRCATPVKNFFVHKVGGTIVRGFGYAKCESCSSCSTSPEPR